MYNNPYLTQNQMYNPMPRIQQMDNVTQPINPQSYMPPVQATTNQPTLLGKMVDSIDAAKTMEYPLDGSTSYFVLTDGSAIVTKKLQADGTSKTTVFRPVDEDKKEVPQYVTIEQLDKKLESLNNSDIDDFKEEVKEEFKDIRRDLKELKGRKTSKED